MGFYSSITLATSGKNIDKQSVISILQKTEIIIGKYNDREYEVCDEICKIFERPEWKNQNSSLFCPGSISIYDDAIECCDLESEMLRIQGFGISFHGNGYFFPVTLDDMIKYFFESPVMIALENNLMNVCQGSLIYTGSQLDHFSRLTYTKDKLHWTYVLCET
jgi:hypothetical protein